MNIRRLVAKITNNGFNRTHWHYRPTFHWHCITALHDYSGNCILYTLFYHLSVHYCTSYYFAICLRNYSFTHRIILFPNLRKFIEGRKFADDDDVIWLADCCNIAVLSLIITFTLYVISLFLYFITIVM